MDISEVIINFFLVTLLGLLIAFNPSLIVLNFLLVLKSKRPILNALLLVCGVLLPLVIVYLICVIWLKPDSSFSVRGSLPDIHLPPLIDIVFGTSLIVYATLYYSKRRLSPKKDSVMSDKTKNMLESPWSIFSFGLIRSCLSITNLLAVVVLAKTMTVNEAKPIVSLLSIIWAVLIGLSPLLAAPFTYRYSPGLLKSIEKIVNKVLIYNSSAIVPILLAVAGLVFLVRGVLHINGGT